MVYATEKQVFCRRRVGQSDLEVKSSLKETDKIVAKEDEQSKRRTFRPTDRGFIIMNSCCWQKANLRPETFHGRGDKFMHRASPHR